MGFELAECEKEEIQRKGAHDVVVQDLVCSFEPAAICGSRGLAGGRPGEGSRSSARPAEAPVPRRGGRRGLDGAEEARCLGSKKRI